MTNSTFVYATYIATTPEKLWEALTRGEFTKQYWFGHEVKSDWVEGSDVKLLPSDFRDESEGFYGYNNGWPAILSNLKSVLETGRALPELTV